MKRLTIFLFAASLVAPVAVAQNTNYRKEFLFNGSTEWKADKYSSTNGTNLACDSSANKNTGELKVLAKVKDPAGSGKATATAELYTDFVYDHEKWTNDFSLEYSLEGIGEILTTVETSNLFTMKMELYRVPNSGGPELLHSRTGVSLKNWNGSIEDSSRFIRFAHELDNGKKYRVLILVRGQIQTSVASTDLAIDFFSSSRVVKALKVVVSHSHDTLECACGKKEKVGEFVLKTTQNEFDKACRLEIKAEPTRWYRSQMTGAYFKTWDFKTLGCNFYQSQQYAEATARNTNGIPRDHTSKVEVHLWGKQRWSGCSNQANIEGTWFDSCDAQGKAIPKHGWAVLDPVAVTGGYRHPLVMQNPGSTTLRIGALTYLATTTNHDNLMTIPFPDDPVYEISLPPNSATTINSIITSCPLVGGTIYFTYEVFDPDDASGKVMCTAWGEHEVFGLSGSPGTLSLSRGGKQVLTVSAGDSRAKMSYLVAGSLFGTSPGFQIGPNLVVPLAQDGYFMQTILFPNTFLLENSSGILDSKGKAVVTFNLPSNLPPTLAGRTLNHACVVFDAGGISLVSNAVSLGLTR